MGLPEFAISARSVSATQLIERFTELQIRSEEIHAELEERLLCKQREAEAQFEDLATLIDAGGNPSRRRHQVEPRGSGRPRLAAGRGVPT